MSLQLSTADKFDSGHIRSLELNDSHFKWVSIRRFMYLAFAASSSFTTYDMFSIVNSHKQMALISYYILLEIIAGITYMCMDLFIKQYTKKMNFYCSLNPLLRGVMFGMLLQTSLWMLLNASMLSETLVYVTLSTYDNHPWQSCLDIDNNISKNACFPSEEINANCLKGIQTNITSTSTHMYYEKTKGGGELTKRYFIIALVWFLNFIFASVAEITLLKLLKLTFVLRILSTTGTFFVLVLTENVNLAPIIAEMFTLTDMTRLSVSVDQVSFTFGIGMIGVYDLGSMSPYTMVDNAIILFAVVFTALGFVRSLIMSIISVTLQKCVVIDQHMYSTNYVLFVILPLGSESLITQKLYLIYFYLNVIFGIISYLALLTIIISKLLQSEFGDNIKTVYIVGVVCIVGFCFSLPLAPLQLSRIISGLVNGLCAAILYLGGFKAAIVMWVYGVNKFSTDIHFWLGYKPTRFWTICWSMLPLLLLILMVVQFAEFVKRLNDESTKVYAIAAIVWVSVTVLIVALFHIKTVAKYLFANKLVGIFLNTPNYGPPDPDDKKQRRNYDETADHRKCNHWCIIMDDKFECNHLTLSNTRRHVQQHDETLLNIYDDSAQTDRQESTIMDLSQK